MFSPRYALYAYAVAILLSSLTVGSVFFIESTFGADTLIVDGVNYGSVSIVVAMLISFFILNIYRPDTPELTTEPNPKFY